MLIGFDIADVGSIVKLTKMLATVEDIKYEVNDVVSGYNW